jgi:hypothetical protein
MYRHIHIAIDIHIYIYIYTCMCVYIYIYICSYTYVCMFVVTQTAHFWLVSFAGNLVVLALSRASLGKRGALTTPVGTIRQSRVWPGSGPVRTMPMPDRHGPRPGPFALGPAQAGAVPDWARLGPAHGLGFCRAGPGPDGLDNCCPLERAQRGMPKTRQARPSCLRRKSAKIVIL